jgi:hypothetical protein
MEQLLLLTSQIMNAILEDEKTQEPLSPLICKIFAISYTPRSVGFSPYNSFNKQSKSVC